MRSGKAEPPGRSRIQLEEAEVSLDVPRRREGTIGPPSQLGGRDGWFTIEGSPHVGAVAWPDQYPIPVSVVVYRKLTRWQHIVCPVPQDIPRNSQGRLLEPRILTTTSDQEI